MKARPETAQDQQNEILEGATLQKIASRATWDKMVKRNATNLARPASQLQTPQLKVTEAKTAKSPSDKAPSNPAANAPGASDE